VNVEEAGMSQGTRPDAPAHGALPAYTQRQTGWVGWVVFAAVMLVLLGAMHAFQGVVALVREEFFVVGKSGLVVSVDYTAWGWAHLVGGALAVVVGIGLLAGQVWARLVAVLVAVLSALVNVAFLAAYPLWSALMIAVDVLVIWAVTVHGDELRRSDDEDVIGV
jgi:hypothetical protein